MKINIGWLNCFHTKPKYVQICHMTHANQQYAEIKINVCCYHFLFVFLLSLSLHSFDIELCALCKPSRETCVTKLLNFALHCKNQN